MNFRLPRPWALAVVALVAVLAAQQFWVWVVERVEVPPGFFLVRIHKWGTDLPEDEILAPDDSYKGVMAEVLPEGRHFLNPLFWGHEQCPIVSVPPDKCAVLTRKFGKRIDDAKRLDRGDFLAAKDERGIVREVLLPGSHRINPYAYDYKLVDAVQIKADQVGVRTLKVGADPLLLKWELGQSQYVVPVNDWRGVQDKPVSAGTYYLNPYVEAIVPVDVRSHRVEFTDIEFPSRDGFILKPFVLVTYRVLPEMAPELYVTLTNEGKLHQADSTVKEQEDNEILQKIVLPLIRGNVRIEGSKFDAREFISAGSGPKPAGATTNPRERLQQVLMEKVGPRCLKEGIVIESVTLAQMDAPPELSAQIRERELARVAIEKNQDRIAQFKTEQELKAAEALKTQVQEKVDAGTRQIQVQTKSQQRKEVEEARFKQELANAKLRLDGAKAQAKATLAAGKAEADVITLQNEAEVSGLRKAVSGFPTPDHYAQYQVLAKLAPALTEIFASDTSDFAKLFSAFLIPPPNRTAGAPATTAGAGGTTAAAPGNGDK